MPGGPNDGKQPPSPTAGTADIQGGAACPHCGGNMGITFALPERALESAVLREAMRDIVADYDAGRIVLGCDIIARLRRDLAVFDEGND